VQDPVERSGSDRRSKRWTPLVAVSLIVAGTLILGGILPILNPSPDDQIHVGVGDALHYDISGYANGTALHGTVDFTITSSTDSVLDYSMTVSTNFGWPNYLDFRPGLSDGSFGSLLIANEEISTSFGTKCVKLMGRYDTSTLILTDVGLDSFLVYRLTAIRPGFSCAIQLTETNITGISQSDTRMQSILVEGRSTVSENPQSEGFPGGGGGIWMYGSIEVQEGQRIRYNMSGQPAKIYVFTLSDFYDMENDGEFSCNATLSLVNVTGEVDVLTDKGTYWFVFDYMFGETEATFTYYWQ
jgi:hypothetical protein